jgi:thymidine phosphorylase
MVALTLAMCDSGRVLKWSGMNKPVVDKHSTGGVGDKVSLVLAPLLAAMDLAVPMVSGRGLGFTGGTLDKLESIPGFRTDISVESMQKQVSQIGLAFGRQTDEIAPADRKLYALRDVTATVESIPLITASILSKKLAESLDALVLDVKWGSGAFMQSLDSARKLARALVSIAGDSGMKVSALLTNMNQPLGFVAGNWCEVAESLDILRGQPTRLDRGEIPARLADDTRTLSIELAAETLCLVGKEKDLQTARTRATAALTSGKAFEIFAKAVAAQGGDVKALRDYSFIPKTSHTLVISANGDGFVGGLNVRLLGHALVAAGAGRAKQADTVDPATSLQCLAPIGSAVTRGQPLFVMTTNNMTQISRIESLLRDSVTLTERAPEKIILVTERVTA